MSVEAIKLPLSLKRVPRTHTPVAIYSNYKRTASKFVVCSGNSVVGLTLLTSLVAQMVKNPPAIQKTQVQSLCWEGPLEKKMATHTSILEPGEVYGQRSLAGYTPWGCKELDTTERLTLRLGVMLLDVLNISWDEADDHI